MPNPRHLLIRHAHRPEFTPGDLGNEVSITQEGKNAIEQLSHSLANTRPTQIFTSPVKRCMETALELCKALHAKIPIVPSTLLGNPGFLVFDPSQAFTVFSRYSTIEVLHLLVSGPTPQGFYPFEIGCAKMLGAILEQKKTSSLSISHDLNIAVLGCWLFDTPNGQEMIPAFLEGIEFDFTGEKVIIAYRDFKIVTNEASLREKINSKLNLAR